MLKSAVDALPEVYQPIYGHSEMNLDISRDCQDRLETIKKVSDCISKKLGRPLNILDIGCAQGFMSLSLAEGGHKVTGIDFLDANINVCKALLEENPESKVVFRHTDLEDFVPGINKDEYDLVLCLSVIHHVAHQDGFDFAQDLIKQLSEKTAAGIYELALKSEPLYWNDNLPEDHREFLTDYDYICRLSETSTHLSVIKRPLIYASNRFAYMPATDEAQEFCARIIKAKRNPHNVADNVYYGTRRYCFTEDGLFIKLTQLQMPEHPELEEINRNESEREAGILSRFKDNELFPELIRLDEKPDEVHLVRKNLDGKLLSEAITDGTEYDPQRVVAGLLDFCVFLEENGLYHSDLRVWNMLLTPEGDVRVIDYGAITEEYTDIFPPYDPVVSLIITVWEIFNREIRSVRENRVADIRGLIRSLGGDEVYHEMMGVNTDSQPFAQINNIFKKHGFCVGSPGGDDKTVAASVLVVESMLNSFLEECSREDRSRWNEIQAANSRIDNLEKENGYRRQDEQALNIHINNLWQGNRELNGHVENLWQGNRELNGHVENLWQENGHRSREIQNLIEDADGLRVSGEKQNDSIKDLYSKTDAEAEKQIVLDGQIRQLLEEKSSLEARIAELENSKPRRYYVKMCKGVKQIKNAAKEAQEVAAKRIEKKCVHKKQKNMTADLDRVTDNNRKAVMAFKDLDVVLHGNETDIMAQIRAEVYREARKVRIINGRISPVVRIKRKIENRPSVKQTAKDVDRKLIQYNAYRKKVRPVLLKGYHKIKNRPLNADYMYDLNDEDFVREMYSVFLKRVPGEEEYNHNLNMLREKKSTRKDMIFAFNNAPENNIVRQIKGNRYYNDN